MTGHIQCAIADGSVTGEGIDAVNRQRAAANLGERAGATHGAGIIRTGVVVAGKHRHRAAGAIGQAKVARAGQIAQPVG